MPSLTVFNAVNAAHTVCSGSDVSVRIAATSNELPMDPEPERVNSRHKISQDRIALNMCVEFRITYNPPS